MVSRVLVPLDGSTLAETILPYVKQLAGAMKLKVELLDVTEPAAGPPEKPADTEKRLADADGYLKKVSEYFKGSAATVATRVAKGNPAVEIAQDANGTTGTLTAMSTHGRSGISRWLIGSVADKTLHNVDGPLLVNHPAPRSPIAGEPVLRQVIVPVDGSALSEMVLTDVVAMAKAMDLDVIILQVTPSVADLVRVSSDPSGYSSAYIDFAGIVEQGDAEAKKYLAATVAKLKGQGLSKVNSRLEHGDAAAVINDLSAPNGTFVAMTTAGRSGVARTVLGSTADRVVSHGGSPVYLVRPPA